MGDSKDYLDGAPTGGPAAPGAPAGAGGFIGVPDGYAVEPALSDWFHPERQILGPQGQLLGAKPRTPLYPDDSENVLYERTPEEIADLQAQMAQAGLIGPRTKFRVGMADDVTRSAYRKLLGTANQFGITQKDALSLLAATPEMRGDGTMVGSDDTGGPTHSVNKTISDPVFTDPLTARAVLRQTLEDRLGRAPEADEYHRFRNMLSNAEAGQDVTTTVADTDGQGNSTTRVKRSDRDTDPSPEVIADQMSRTGKLGREANTRAAGVDYFDAAANLIGGL